jgi:hypothetical protein
VDHHCIWINSCVGYHNCMSNSDAAILMTRQAIPTVRQLWSLTITIHLYRKLFEYDPLPPPSGGLYFKLASRDGRQRTDACFIHAPNLHRGVLHHEHRDARLMETVITKRHWKTSLIPIHRPFSKIDPTTSNCDRAGGGTTSLPVLRGLD